MRADAQLSWSVLWAYVAQRHERRRCERRKLRRAAATVAVPASTVVAAGRPIERERRIAVPVLRRRARLRQRHAQRMQREVWRKQAGVREHGARDAASKKLVRRKGAAQQQLPPPAMQSMQPVLQWAANAAAARAAAAAGVATDAATRAATTDVQRVQMRRECSTVLAHKRGREGSSEQHVAARSQHRRGLRREGDRGARCTTRATIAATAQLRRNRERLVAHGVGGRSERTPHTVVG